MIFLQQCCLGISYTTSFLVVVFLFTFDTFISASFVQGLVASGATLMNSDSTIRLAAVLDGDTRGIVNTLVLTNVESLA